MKAPDRARGEILEAIAAGELVVGDPLPSEAHLAERCGVSRLTVREAVSTLAAAGVLDVQQGRRGRIAPPERWSVLDPAVLAVRARLTGDTAAVVAELMDARRVLEVGIARLAAPRITETHLESLRRQIEIMEAEVDGDAERTARADVAFHEVIVDAAANPYLTGAFAPLQEVLLSVRVRTSTPRPVRVAAIGWHRTLLDALAARDADAAERAMSGHMEQTAAATDGVSLD